MALKSKVVAITSPTHSMALVLYFITAIQGVLFFTDFASARGVEAILNGRTILFYVWAFVFAVSGALCFLSALTSQYFRVKKHILHVELVGVILFGAAWLLYEISLHKQGFGMDSDLKQNLPYILHGFTFAATTQLLALGAVFGAIFRAVQIIVDLRKLRSTAVQQVRDDYFVEG